MRRQLLKVLTVCLGLVAVGAQMPTAKAQTPPVNRILVFENAGRLCSVSGNAKWATGYLSKEAGYLVNLETEEVIELLGGEVGSSEAWAVANDGTVFGVANNLPAYWNSEGVFQGYLPVPGDPSEGVVSGVTPDGKYVSGYVYGTGFKGVPLRWERKEDGTYQYRKLAVWDKDYFGKKILGGFYVDGMSRDGSMLLGRMCDNEYAWFPCIWKNIEEDEAPTLWGLEYMLTDGRWSGWNGSPMSFTKDGKYAYGLLEDNNEAFGPSYPAIMEVATGKTELKETQGSIMGVVFNNGDIISGQNTGTPYRDSYMDRANGNKYTLANFLLELYGLDISETILDQTGTVMGMSDDERTLVGFAGVNGTGFGGFVYQLGDPSGDPVSVSEVQAAAPVVISENGTIVVKGAAGYPIVVSDMAGKVLDTTIGSDATVIPAVKGKAYIIKVAMDKASYIKKVMVV